ncbi:RNA recognition motif domain-containing protein [Alteromonas facilis]|uniref:RNA recognition motif domain-containing protein n=1 Tax=Alteromonas facilis TaxID=2048004 RepID=UPI000C28A29C|nr:RNA-binding protein [Alteromonas facilis]
MNVKLPQCLAIAIALSLLSFFTADFLLSLTSANIMLAVLVFVAAMATPFIASLFNRGSLEGDDTSSASVTTLYVGNLPYRANEDAVKAYFQTHTKVQSVRLMKDKRTGKRKGYGFVEIISSDVDRAIDNLNDSVFQDRTLKVRFAKDKVVSD